MNYRNLAICIATSLSLHALPAIATEDGNKPNANWPSWEDNQADSDSLILQGATILQAPPPPSSEPTGPLSGIGKYLKSNGIELGILFNDFFLYQYQTGRIPNSTMNSSDIKYHVGLDLEKIMGIPNTKLKFDLTQYLTSQNAFDFVVFSNSYFFPGAGGYDSTMLSRLSIESTFMDGRLTVELGRMNPIFDFMMPTFCGLCFNGTQARNAFFPGPDAQVWGGRAAYRLNPHDTVQVGLYENDLYVFQKTNGWYFSTDQAIGYIALANYVHETTFLDEEKPVNMNSECSIIPQTTTTLC
ncbi:carbohydrate porin [Xanthobacter autotrophicus]|uniref:carbohydrate porin n=1 Tax=Xanthobacter autotrophicus TaxID=280 RepID=UPI0024A6293D|nr:carbohydrate porin [Xanthobacter autotrophicus]MDI4655321.1 carbohydrate porin [Xanthobacter autotrophicus]